MPNSGVIINECFGHLDASLNSSSRALWTRTQSASPVLAQTTKKRNYFENQIALRTIETMFQPKTKKTLLFSSAKAIEQLKPTNVLLFLVIMGDMRRADQSKPFQHELCWTPFLSAFRVVVPNTGVSLESL